MSIEKIQAYRKFIFIIKDKSPAERNGFKVPADSVEKDKPNTGKIISVGSMVEDKAAIVGKIAIFNKQVGQSIAIFDTDITVLNEEQILGII